MKKIIIVLSALLYIFTIPVFASEEDILYIPIQDDIKEDVKEDIKEDVKEDLKGNRAVVTDPLEAVSIGFYFYYNGNNNFSCYGNVDQVSLNDKYIIKFNPASGSTYEYLKDAVGYPDIGYFVRGEELNNQTFTWHLGENVYNGSIRSFNNTSVASNVAMFEQYNSTPEPTPTPEPEEPEVDPETISGNEILREILRTNREINENVKGIYKYLSNNSVSDSVLSDNSVSDNLIYKKLEDYNTSESLALIGLVLAFGALLIYVIHKSVFKIRR